MFRCSVTLLLITAITVLITSCGPRGEEQPVVNTTEVSDTPYDPVTQGRTHYVRYCASCHGSDGQGGGPVAEALKEAPTDITQMRIEAAGTFDVDNLTEVIRGLKDVRAHGTREMPVWGNIWGDESLPVAAPEQIEKRINELVEYIRSIQE